MLIDEPNNVETGFSFIAPIAISEPVWPSLNHLIPNLQVWQKTEDRELVRRIMDNMQKTIEDKREDDRTEERRQTIRRVVENII